MHTNILLHIIWHKKYLYTRRTGDGTFGAELVLCHTQVGPTGAGGGTRA